MKIAYFDCFSGAAGDMIVGACLDAGVDSCMLLAELAKLGLDHEMDIQVGKTSRKGISATTFNPTCKTPAHFHESHPSFHSPHQHGRHLPEIRDLIIGCGLSETVQKKSLAIFERLAQAEAKIHGIEVDQVHFHEVGAADAILDIVGACVGLELLGVEKVLCSALVTGTGTVRCQHGVLPVPAPATAELIRGIPVQAGTVEMELLTPTGAAILTTLCTAFGSIPPMQIERIGYGAGQKENPHIANVLRLLVGETDIQAGEGADEVVVLEANLDDTTGEQIGYATERLLSEGALDVFCVPIQMKKNRPGTLLSVICCMDDYPRMQDVLFQETTTFGVRRTVCQRQILSRSYETVETEYGAIRIKIGCQGDRMICTSPEFQDCQQAATKHGVSLKNVMSAALRVFQNSIRP